MLMFARDNGEARINLHSDANSLAVIRLKAALQMTLTVRSRRGSLRTQRIRTLCIMMNLPQQVGA